MTAADSYFQDVTDQGGSVAGSWGNTTNCTLDLGLGQGLDGYPALFPDLNGIGRHVRRPLGPALLGTQWSRARPTVSSVSSRMSASRGHVRSVWVGQLWRLHHRFCCLRTVGHRDRGRQLDEGHATATAPTGAVTCALFAKVQSVVGANDDHVITRAMISNADQQGNVCTAWAPGGRGLVPARPVQVLATSALVTYPVYYGFVDSWVPAYSGPILSDQVINCTDGLNLLALAYVCSRATQTRSWLMVPQATGASDPPRWRIRLAQPDEQPVREYVHRCHP